MKAGHNRERPPKDSRQRQPRTNGGGGGSGGERRPNPQNGSKSSSAPAASPAPKKSPLQPEFDSLVAQLQDLRCDPFAPAVFGLCERLSATTRTILLESADPSIQEQTLSGFWRKCAYKIINSFRARAKDNEKKAALSEEDLKVFMETYAEFLQNTMNFFSDLINNLVAKYRLKFVELIIKENASLSLSKKEGIPTLDHDRTHPAISTCHQALIYLGDLARYLKEGKKQSQTKNTIAIKYYHKALLLNPDNGNPHNQLAVVASSRDPLENAYRCFRSGATRSPFATAKENTKALFLKNATLAATITSQSSIEISNALNLRTNFFVIFIHAHYCIQYQKKLDSFKALKRTLFDLYKKLVQESKLTNEQLIKITVMNITTLHLVRSSPNPSIEAAKIALNLLLIMLMPLIKKAATRIKSNYLHGKLCLGALSIFCEWAQTHYELISGDSYLWDEIAPLLSHLARTPFSESDFNLSVMDRETLPLLPEEIELRGFKHLAEAHRALPLFSAHAEPSDFDLPNMEGLYHAIRISKILSFGTFIVNIYGQHHLIYQPESKLFSSRKTLRSGNSSRSRRRSKRSPSSPPRNARARASKPTRTRALASKPSAIAVSEQRSTSGRPTLSESSPSVLATSPVHVEKTTRGSQAKEVVSLVPDVEVSTLGFSAPSANQRSRVRRIADDDADQEEVFFNEDGVLEQDGDHEDDSDNEEGDEDDDDDDDEYEYEEEEIEYEEYVEDDEYDEEEEIRKQQEEADSEDDEEDEETPHQEGEKNSRSQADQQRGLQTSQTFLSSGLSPLLPPSSSSSSSSSSSNWSPSPLANTSFFSAAPIASLPTGPSLWPSWDQSQFFAQDGTKQTNQYQLFSRDAFLSKLSDQYSSDKT